MQYEKVRGFLHDVKADGLKVAFGGQEIPTTASATGYYIHPTIVDNPPDTARIVTEEPFGPILPLLSWETEDEVVARANATNYGLGASIWSDNEEEAERIARQIESGTVWVNGMFQFPFLSGTFVESRALTKCPSLADGTIGSYEKYGKTVLT